MPALQSSSRYPTEVGVLIADVQMQSYKGTTRYLPHTNHTAQIPLRHGQFPSWYLHHMSGYRCHTQPLWPVPASFFPFFSLILYAALPCQPPKSSTFRGWFFFFFSFFAVWHCLKSHLPGPLHANSLGIITKRCLAVLNQKHPVSLLALCNYNRY